MASKYNKKLLLIISLTIICLFIILYKNVSEGYRMNKIINTAFIIPTYPRHYFDLYKFIETIYDIIDIYIVFTNIEEYYMFREKDKIKRFTINS